MSTVALLNLWNYIQGMSLSDRNKKWLADRLIESTNISKSKSEQISLERRIERGRKEIREGNCTTCTTKDELKSFLDSL